MAISISSFLQWKPNVFLYRKLGRRFTSSYLFFLGSLYFWLRQEERMKISASVHELFGAEKKPLELNHLKEDIFQGILCHYYEKIFNAYKNLPELTSFMMDHIRAPSLYKLEDALKKNQGVLFVTGHYGGVEYIPGFLGMHRFPVSVVFKCATSQLREALNRKALDLGVKLIDSLQENSMGAVLQDLRENRIVFIECDEIEAWKPSREEKMRFLGKRIGVDRTLNIIQRRSGAEIVFGILHRLNLENYVFIIETFQDLLSHFGATPPSQAAVLLKLLEKYIYAYPEQWYQWKHYANLDASSLLSETAETKFTRRFLKPSFRPA
jgi:Kdo2-lipid IVA lauroyltransferase/acyltransferase